MKFTKLLSLILCVSLLFSITAFAQNESEKMKDALTKVKTVLSVPQEYTDFSYRSQTDADGTLYWQFSWSGENKGNMEATVSEDGFLASYYAWVYTDSYDDSLAKYTHEEAKEIAKEFIKTVNPQLYPFLREITPNGENRGSRTAQFLFMEYIGDIPVYGNTVSVTVDKYHGTIRNYQGTRKTQSVGEGDIALTEAAAKSAYIKDIGIEFSYRLYYNYKEKSYTVYPVYFLKDSSQKAIDALTGQVLEAYFPESYIFGNYRGMNLMADATAKEESAGGVQFTPEELEALSNLETVYSQEEALEIATEKIPALSSFSMKTVSLNRDFQDETKLFWSFQLQNETSLSAHVTLDAKTGQLISFSLPTDDEKNQNLTEEEAIKIAEAFLQKEASDVFSKTQYTKDTYRYVPYRENEEHPRYYWLTFERMENGIPVQGNQLSVRVDGNSRSVGAYDRTWTENLSFPDISTCLSKEEIMEHMDDKMEFTLTYLPTKEGYRKAYTFLNQNQSNFNPFNGKILNYDGTDAVDHFIPNYSDIHGHWGEKMILTLLDNGYYVSENEFRPDMPITKKEFLTLFQMIGNDTDEQIKEFIAKIEETPVDEVDIHAPITKETLSRYFVYRMGYQKIAALDHIFLYPFLDEDTDPNLKGDIALIAGLGIFRGNAHGYFYPQKSLTRAEAASAIYHYLKN